MTTSVSIDHEQYTQVAEAGEGPGIFTVAVTGGAFYRIDEDQPGDTAPGHFVAEKESIELTKALSTGKKLWMRAANSWDGLVVKTLDSEV